MGFLGLHGVITLWLMRGLATLSGYTAAILLQYVLKQGSSPHLLQGQMCLQQACCAGEAAPYTAISSAF